MLARRTEAILTVAVALVVATSTASPSADARPSPLFGPTVTLVKQQLATAAAAPLVHYKVELRAWIPFKHLVDPVAPVTMPFSAFRDATYFAGPFSCLPPLRD